MQALPDAAAFSVLRPPSVTLRCPWGSRAAETYLCLTALASGSMLDSLTSTKRSRVGSALAPAPATHSTGMPRCLHAARRATCKCSGSTADGRGQLSTPRHTLAHLLTAGACVHMLPSAAVYSCSLEQAMLHRNQQQLSGRLAWKDCHQL